MLRGYRLLQLLFQIFIFLDRLLSPLFCINEVLFLDSKLPSEIRLLIGWAALVPCWKVCQSILPKHGLGHGEGVSRVKFNNSFLAKLPVGFKLLQSLSLCFDFI